MTTVAFLLDIAEHATPEQAVAMIRDSADLLAELIRQGRDISTAEREAQKGDDDHGETHSE